MGFGKQGTGVIIRQADTITLLTLAVNGAVKQDNPLVLGEDFRLLKTEAFLGLSGATFVDADGPIIIGMADNELSAAEIAECLVADGPLDRNDNVSSEQSMRPVWPLWSMPFTAADTNLNPTVALRDTKVRWTFSNPEGFAFFVSNLGTSPLTTGGVVSLFAKHYGVWVT